METKKSVFQKVKDWWKNDLSENDRDWVKAVAIWTFDGALFGSMITAARKNRQMKLRVKGAEARGYLAGTIDAYREVSLNQQQTYIPNKAQMEYVLPNRMPANYVNPQQNQFKKH